MRITMRIQEFLQFNNSHINNNRIYIAPYSHDFSVAGGRSDQCSVKARVNKKVCLDLRTRHTLIGDRGICTKFADNSAI